MTKQEASRQYRIPMKILDEYEACGLCSETKKGMGVWQYDDSDLERLGLMMTLHDAGFTDQEVETYMRLFLMGASTEKQRMELIRQKRKNTLDEIHFRETQISRLDYLQHEIAKECKALNC